MKPTFSNSPSLRKAQRILSAIFLGMIFLMIPFGDKMDTDPVFGMVSVALGLIIGSALLYTLLCLPVRDACRKDLSLRLLFKLATFGVVISPFHIPLWGILTREFPPEHFDPWTIWIVMPLIGLSIIGPMMPIMVLMHRAELERKKQKSKLHNQQVDPIVTTPVDEVEVQGTQGHP